MILPDGSRWAERATSNFVSTSKERIEQAKEDWKAGWFAPVPETGPAVVRYP
ncbi:MAG: hypothetical protein ACRD68_12385 [Pyrinomonadaceae bacterium]